jgi:hypothetical protein
MAKKPGIKVIWKSNKTGTKTDFEHRMVRCYTFNQRKELFVLHPAAE